MATDDSNKIVVTEQDGAVDSILTYLKERIESPFLMSFVFSWSVINRDYLFYLFLSDDSKKHYQLANWDFSAFLFSDFCYNAYSQSIWHPLFFGGLMAIVFSPISIGLSGIRYWALKNVMSWTSARKEDCDGARAVAITQKKLDELRSVIAGNEEKILGQAKKIDDTELIWSNM
jgi:hypothetical protein